MISELSSSKIYPFSDVKINKLDFSQSFPKKSKKISSETAEKKLNFYKPVKTIQF